MAFKIMTVPLPETQDRDLDVNAFMVAHTVVSVQRRVVTTSEEAYVVFMIEYVPSPQENARTYASAEKTERKDWRAALSDDDFRVFNLLREERAKIADEEGVKVFNIFTNAQLVDIVRGKVLTKAQLGSVPQVGESRVRKYADRILAVMNRECQG